MIYTYTPYNRGATIESDAVYGADDPRKQCPAGNLRCARDISGADASPREYMDGRYARRVTRRQAERAFGRDYVRDLRAEVLAGSGPAGGPA